MIQDIRWVERDGKQILQVARYGNVAEDGAIQWTWVDVPLEAETD